MKQLSDGQQRQKTARPATSTSPGRFLLTLALGLEIFVLFGLLMISSVALATEADRTILLSEDFSSASDTPPPGWVNNVMTGDESVDLWRFDNPGERDLIPPIVEPAAIFDSDAVSDNDQPELVSLDSPTFDARGYDYIGLSFDHYFRATDGDNNFIYVDVYDGSQWHEVYASGDSSQNPDHLLIDVSARLAGVENARVSLSLVGKAEAFTPIMSKWL